eukprot:6174859-Pleurochrysis_carterae.AAC.2
MSKSEYRLQASRLSQALMHIWEPLNGLVTAQEADLGCCSRHISTHSAIPAPAHFASAQWSLVGL